jgi:preprotein translocase subunit SecD
VLLGALVVIIVVMFAAIIGGEALHPGSWHQKFKIGLGLDLAGGTSVTLKAVADHGGVPSKADMTQAIAILNSRFNALGVNNTTVVQQGSQYINVSIPGTSAEKIAPLLTAAELRFRQVLLCTTPIPGSAICQPSGRPAGAGLPSAGPVTSPTPAVTPAPSVTPKASATPKTSPSTGSSASPKPSASGKSGGTGQVVRARQLAVAPRAQAAPASSPSPSPSTSASASPQAAGSASPSPSASASPSPSASSTPAASLYTVGDPSMVSKPTLALFKKLSCADKRWQETIYGIDSAKWDNRPQIVSCDSQGIKYVLGPPIVLGQWLKSPSAGLDSQSGQWVVTFNLNGQGTTAFGQKTVYMYDHYSNAGTATSPLDQFAIVLDGKVVSAPTIQQPITTGSGQITGSFTQNSATALANVLKYGALPLSFTGQQIQSVSAQLGASQLHAGLIAAAIGLLLVVIYSFLYYRGLAIVSVLSLSIAALIAWLAVTLLYKYDGYTLSLAGIAGLIVAIGITADSFVVYFERLRDEVREGRSLRAAVERGWERARRTILVSDTVSFLAALLLYIFSISDVRGFAFTLGLTTLIDIVVVFLFTKPMVTLLARTKFYGQGHKWSGLDPARLGSRSPWRGSRVATARPATGATATATASPAARTTPKEA